MSAHEGGHWQGFRLRNGDRRIVDVNGKSVGVFRIGDAARSYDVLRARPPRMNPCQQGGM